MKRISFQALLVFVFSFTLAAGAAPVDSSTAAAAVKQWLASEATPLGAKLGNQIGSVDTFKDQAGTPLYHVVYVKPAGFVIVAADDRAEPIIAFADAGRFDPSEKSPLGAIVARDLPKRIALAQRQTATAVAMRNRGKWQKLTPALAGTNLTVQPKSLTTASISDLRVAPFITTSWNQTTVDNAGGPACYNYFTPPHAEGSSDNAPCGCVATAMAQVMYYNRYPSTAVGTNAFLVTYADSSSEPANSMLRQTRGGDGNGGPYDYDSMPAAPSTSSSALQRAAIGALTSDAGVAVHMAYALDTSGAYLTDAESAFLTTFKYANAILTEGTTINVGYDLYNMINANLDARIPVIFGIEDTDKNGHCIVCDGYGFSAYGTMYHHLNMGWGGVDTAWYQLPIIDVTDVSPFYNFDACLYNLFTNTTGEIVSGRVLDPKGNPLVGATVSGMSTKGGVFNTVTDAKGIYAFVGVPSDSTCIVSVNYNGFFPATSNILTATSINNGKDCGNMWEMDFFLVPAQGAPVFKVAPGSQAVTVGSNAVFYASATGQLPLHYQWQYQPSGSLNWVNVSDDSVDLGSQTETLIVGPTQLAMNGEPLRCVVTNIQGSITSAPVSLTVESLPFIPVATLAGLPGTPGSTDGLNSGALFNSPNGIAVDSQTNIFVADKNNHVIRKVSPTASGWSVTTIAGQDGKFGSANGVGTNALFDGPFGVAVDGAGRVFVADTGNELIRLLTPSGGNWVVSTIAGKAGVIGKTNGLSALFNRPMGIAVDNAGTVFVADEANHNIRKIVQTGTNWITFTIAGSDNYGSNDGTNTAAQFGQPYGLAVTSSGLVFVADEFNDNIRQLTPSGVNWIVTTIAGSSGVAGSADGIGGSAQFKNPTGIVADNLGNLYVADNGNNTIRRLTQLGTNWLTFTTAGVAGVTGSADGLGNAAQFNSPFAVAVNNGTNVYIADAKNNTIRGPGLPTSPIPPTIHLANYPGSGYVVSWNANAGQSYVVQYKTDLSQPAWNTLTTTTASNWAGVASVPIGNDPQRYYRVVPAQ